LTRTITCSRVRIVNGWLHDPTPSETHPVGFNILIESAIAPPFSSCSALHRTFLVRREAANMASADFCLITPRIAACRAVPVLPFCCRFYALGLTAVAALGSFWFQCGLTGFTAQPAPLVKQISPSKSIIFPCTTAAFTLFAVPKGFVVMCQLAPQTRPSMRFLFVGSHFCTRASFAQALAVLHLPSASGYPCIYENTSSVLPQGTCTPSDHAHVGRTLVIRSDDLWSLLNSALGRMPCTSRRSSAK